MAVSVLEAVAAGMVKVSLVHGNLDLNLLVAKPLFGLDVVAVLDLLEIEDEGLLAEIEVDIAVEVMVVTVVTVMTVMSMMAVMVAMVVMGMLVYELPSVAMLVVPIRENECLSIRDVGALVMLPTAVKLAASAAMDVGKGILEGLVVGCHPESTRKGGRDDTSTHLRNVSLSVVIFLNSRR
jgi:hypothetical protein